jgi:hypothetical protein
MKLLSAQAPTAEQLRIISERRPGVEIIRGAAGSGKTTTALLRLKNLSDIFRARVVRLGEARAVRVLVLTYNRTLCGYVEALARDQVSHGAAVSVEVDTFARWSLERLGRPELLDDRTSFIADLATKYHLNVPRRFLYSEVEYVLGRFPVERLAEYLDIERTGRGTTPRIERPAREIILAIIQKYKDELLLMGKADWDDLPLLMLNLPNLEYDIAILDEAQDFSANQLRAVVAHLRTTHAMTLILDTAQRLYPRGYTWAEVGIRGARFHRLQQNHRNTIEIAHFARGILSGITFDDDGTLPDLNRAVRHGPLPQVVQARFSKQLDFAIAYIRSSVDLSSESVAFLHPLGGGWFSEVRRRLGSAGLSFVEISREREWPGGPTNIALSTMHSAKGLEFDHVIILGLNAEVTPRRADGDDDDQWLTLRRLLAMAVARARLAVIVGYKPEVQSDLVRYFHAGTFIEYQP